MSGSYSDLHPPYRKPIVVVSSIDKGVFERECEKLVNEGYFLDSIVNRYDDFPIFQAVFILPSVKHIKPMKNIWTQK